MSDTNKERERDLQRARLVWEEIMREPDIYRVYEVGSCLNSYLFLSGEDAVVIDPCSEDMLRRIFRLVRMLGAGGGNIRVYLTRPCGGEIYAAAMSDPVFDPAKISLYCCDDPYGEMPSVNSMDRELCGGAEQADEAEPQLLWTQVRDGDIFRIGEKALRVVGLEGCRKGLSGLWFSEGNILFSGGAIGCDELPEVHSWDPNVDTLGLQIEVLRRVRRLHPRCILPLRGSCVGLDRQADEGTDDCRRVLDAMLAQYCLRILEVYQEIPAGGLISAARLLGENDLSCGAGTESCLKYLLYRKYIRQRESADGLVYERGSLRLTDWSLQEKDSGKNPI